MNSEIPWNELQFFSADPDSLPLYVCLRQKLLGMLPGTPIEVKATQISFRNRYLFAAVTFTPVRRKALRPPHYLTVSLFLPARLDSPRIDAAFEVYPNRWTHHIMIGSTEEIDEELLGWLREAAVFAETKKPRRK